MRPYWEMQPHAPAFIACSALGLSLALRFRSQLAKLSLRSICASCSLTRSALHPFPQLLRIPSVLAAMAARPLPPF